MQKGGKYVIGIALGVLAPFLVSMAGGYWLHMLVITVIFASLAVSLNLIMGFTGQINLAHIGFFGIGGYVAALVSIHWHLNGFVALLIGGVAAVLVSLLLGYISLGLREIYFAIATFAFLMLLAAVFSNLENITGGNTGLFGIPSLSLGGFELTPARKFWWYYLVLAFLLFNMFIVERVVDSRIGTALLAIREDEDLAKSTGVNTYWYKMLSFVLSSFLASVAGGLFAFYMGTMTPADCAVTPSIMVIAMCAIGGLGTMLGPVIGAVFVTLLPEVLRPVEDYYYLAFGCMIVFITIFAPNGCMGAYLSLKNKFTGGISKEKG